MLRTLLWGSLLLAPLTIAVDKLTGAGDVTLFVLAALALIPLAWLIGEATEHAAEHTGPGIGGFLNASFGNAPELIVALFAIGANLPVVVRGSLAGSVISNLLLVFGVTQIVGPDGERDRPPLAARCSSGSSASPSPAFTLPSCSATRATPERHTAVVASIPVSIVLLVLYLACRRPQSPPSPAERSATAQPRAGRLDAAGRARRARRRDRSRPRSSARSSSTRSTPFATAVGLSEFFIAVVIVAIVGNAAEHGGAIVIARAGKMQLATEIAISSSAQVALLVVPAVMLLSLFFAHPLAAHVPLDGDRRDGRRGGRRCGDRAGRTLEPPGGRAARCSVYAADGRRLLFVGGRNIA